MFSTRHPTKGASHCSFRRPLSNNYFGKVILKKFARTWNKSFEHCISPKFFLGERYCRGCPAPFEESLKGYFEKVVLIKFTCTWNNLRKHCITLQFSLVEG